MNKTDVIKLRIDSDVKIEMEKIAETKQRTLARQIRLALRERPSWARSRRRNTAETASTACSLVFEVNAQTNNNRGSDPPEEKQDLETHL